MFLLGLSFTQETDADGCGQTALLFAGSSFSGSNVNCSPHRLMCLNPWSPAVDAVGDDAGESRSRT